MSTAKRVLPYGTWPSPVTPADVADSDAPIDWVGFVGGEVWWVESLPEENGRAQLTRAGADGPESVLSPEWSVRNRAGEYGGRPWAAVSSRLEDGVVFCHDPDQRVYRWAPGRQPYALSPTAESPHTYRHADLQVADGFVWCVRETVADAAGRDVSRGIVRLPLDGAAAEDADRVEVMGGTHHFLTGVSFNADQTMAAWIGWDHPHMSWDQTEVWLSERVGAGWSSPRRVTGGPEESITQVSWDRRDGGELVLLSDRSGWWNLYRTDLITPPRPLLPRREEFGDALWRVGQRWFAPLDDGRVITAHGSSGRRLAVLGTDGVLTDLATPDHTEWSDLATDGRSVAVIATGPRRRRSVLRIEPDSGEITVVRAPLARHDEYAATPRLRMFELPDGTKVPAHIHPPYHPDIEGPEGAAAPYLIHAHGGPTSRGLMVMNQEFTYFTSRGIGVVDVQYGGSTGFGRAYRDRLRRNWGVVDADDCAAVARHLIAEGVIDPERVAIRGGSAGGWTSVASLTNHPDLYRAAGVYYPVIDPVSFRDSGTHDFESRYLDSLIGRWPEEASRYHLLSPLRHADRIRAPFALFQGLDDAVCPPEQAERLLARVDETKVRFVYLTFPGEGHGFRRAETIEAALEAELRCYTEAFQFGRRDR